MFKSKHGTGGRQGKRELYYGGVRALNLRPLAFIKEGTVTENGNCGLSIGVASNPNVTGRFLLEEAETLLGKPLKKRSNAKGWGWGLGIQFLTIAGASPSTPKIKEGEEMGLIKKVQLEERCAHDHKPE